MRKQRASTGGSRAWRWVGGFFLFLLMVGMIEEAIGPTENLSVFLAALPFATWIAYKNGLFGWARDRLSEGDAASGPPLRPEPYSQSAVGAPEAYVYVISEMCDQPLTKVGVTNAPWSRRSQIQTGNGRPVAFHSLTPLPTMEDARAVEGAVHREMAHLRGEGEWFKGGPMLAHEQVRKAIDEARSLRMAV